MMKLVKVIAPINIVNMSEKVPTEDCMCDHVNEDVWMYVVKSENLPKNIIIVYLKK